MPTQIPDPLVAWAWRGNSEDRDAIAHFSTLTPQGFEKSWIWLFPNVQTALEVGLLPQFVEDGLTSLIAATIPRSRSLPIQVPLQWLDCLPLMLEGITEIWYGFDRTAYFQTRDIARATTIYPTSEFLKIARWHK